MRFLMKISEFAETCNVHRQTLIYYDKIGLVKPKFIDEENGYRYYGYDQIDLMYVIKVLSDTGMSLHEIGEYIEDRHPQRLLAMLEHQLVKIKEQENYFSRLRESVTARIEQIKECENVELDKVETVHHDKRHLHIGQILPKNMPKEEIRLHFAHFAKEVYQYGLADGNRAGLCNSMSNNAVNLNYFFVYTKSEHSNASLRNGDFLTVHSMCQYGHAEKCYQQIDEYAKAHNLKIVGRYFESYLQDQTCNNDKMCLVCVEVRVEGINGNY